jgi:hypothetical protein
MLRVAVVVELMLVAEAIVAMLDIVEVGDGRAEVYARR